MSLLQILTSEIENGIVQAEWLLKALFTCNHMRTPVREGKCFCPYCGRGVVFQWIVLRCKECHVRRESQYYLRQIIPVQACCAQCGSGGVHWEYLDMSQDAHYFQLDKARILVQEAETYMARRFSWSITASVFNDTFNETLRKTQAWLDPAHTAPALQPALISASR